MVADPEQAIVRDPDRLEESVRKCEAPVGRFDPGFFLANEPAV
jgi:hypothetical protein